MVANGTSEDYGATELIYDRKNELKAFDDTKAGVKGLVDAGIVEVPRIFIHPPDKFDEIFYSNKPKFILPTIDLDGVDKDPIRRKQIVDKVREASETWGFFQVVNHGISVGVLEEMLDRVRSFYEQDTEVKKQWYTRNNTQTFVYNSNFDLFSTPAANWRDSFYCTMAPRSASR